MNAKHRTYNDYYRAYLRCIRGKRARLSLATKLHDLAHAAAREHQAQQFYNSWIDAAIG